MIDYAAINEAMEKTRQGVRRHLMSEGATAERARIVAWGREEIRKIRKGGGTATDARVWKDVIDAIEIGEHASEGDGP